METRVFQKQFHDPSDGLRDGWTWVREEENSWRIDDGEGLLLPTLPGGIWNSEMKPAMNILTMEWPSSSYDGVSSRSPLAVEIRVRVNARCWGEQAGLVLYNADDDWVKLVVEGMVWFYIVTMPKMFTKCCSLTFLGHIFDVLLKHLTPILLVTMQKDGTEKIVMAQRTPGNAAKVVAKQV